jgi:hypothetical protein
MKRERPVDKPPYGKILVRMELKTEQAAITPPKLIASLSEGFSIIANRFYLILIPVILDLFLWLGPRLSFQTILSNLFTNLNTNLASYPDMADLVVVIQNMEKSIGNVNFFSLLRSIPIGLPSLMAYSGDSNAPLPGIGSFTIGSSFFTLILVALGLFTLGIFLGSLFFSFLAQAAKDEKTKLSVPTIFKQFLQCILLTLAVFVILIVLSIPVSLFANIIAVIAPGIYGIAIYVVAIFIIWLLLPIVFCAHGIYLDNRNALQSISVSIHFVRSNMSGTGIFILSAVLINMGLNILWGSPSASSWLQAIGIFGHAFIFSSLLAASFVYYRNGLKWMKEKHRRAVAHSKYPATK